MGIFAMIGGVKGAIKLALAVSKIFQGIINSMHDAKMMDAGARDAILKGSREADAILQKMLLARASVKDTEEDIKNDPNRRK